MGYKINVGLPGVTFEYGVLMGVLQASDGRNEIRVKPSPHPVGNFDNCLADALNDFEAGEITHFAMLHADIWPQANWLDVLVEEMDKKSAALVSVAVPIKDERGVMSCGIGDPADHYVPLRRITFRELSKLPATFGAADFGYPDHVLLHNNGCWLADLRHPEFFATDGVGCLKAMFQFPRRVFRKPETGRWVTDGESEDWYFSRQLHDLGLRNTYVTRRVALGHSGRVTFSNQGDWIIPEPVTTGGLYQHGDEATAYKWRQNGHSTNEKGITHARENLAESR